MAHLLNSYASLPERFFARVKPTSVSAPRLVRYNHALAETLANGWETMGEERIIELLSGNRIPENSTPLAAAYAGHQFAHFVPQLGDGRAILLGEVIGKDGIAREIQLKGAGRTPFSRGGDGRAAIGPVLREYLVSEAMHALGIPTTRALAAIATGDAVYRETLLPGAVLTRVAKSHVRVGTFQFFAARNDIEGLKTLADYVTGRLYPELAKSENPYLLLLRTVADRQASLVARWMQVGFIHGVMNTDNSSISGETIDFGPCAFMDAYDPATVFSSIDQRGRYAYQNQAGIAQWNLARLAECLLPLLSEDETEAVEVANREVAAFGPAFTRYWVEGLRRKVGFSTAQDGDEELIQGLFDIMQAQELDFTRTFRLLADAAEGNDGALLSLLAEPGFMSDWLARWRKRLDAEPQDVVLRARSMRKVNPAYIPRNHLVEEALSAASESGDFAPFEALLDVLSHPYIEAADVDERYLLPARPEERVLRTFCGT